MCACTLGLDRACPLEPRIKSANWSGHSVIGTRSSAPTGSATHSSCGFMPPLLKIAKYGQRVFALVSSSLDEWWQVIVAVPRGQTTSKAPNCCCPLQLQLNLASCCNNQCGRRNRPPLCSDLTSFVHSMQVPLQDAAQPWGFVFLLKHMAVSSCFWCWPAYWQKHFPLSCVLSFNLLSLN